MHHNLTSAYSFSSIDILWVQRQGTAKFPVSPAVINRFKEVVASADIIGKTVVAKEERREWVILGYPLEQYNSASFLFLTQTMRMRTVKLFTRHK